MSIGWAAAHALHTGHVLPATGRHDCRPRAGRSLSAYCNPEVLTGLTARPHLKLGLNQASLSSRTTGPSFAAHHSSYMLLESYSI